MKLWPFFTYYGGKYRSARWYPTPLYPSIVEPFAGSAGYSLHHAELDVTLIEANEKIAGIWTYLTRVSASEIRALPDVNEDVSEIDACQEAKWLIGMWLNKGVAAPRRKPSSWMRGGTHPHSYWGETVRRRIAAQLHAIRHWKVSHGRWQDTIDFDLEATWFVDPPYQRGGQHYPVGASSVDFPALAEACQRLRGQVMVCENAGADWLPFEDFATFKASPARHGGKRSTEVIWLGGHRLITGREPELW